MSRGFAVTLAERVWYGRHPLAALLAPLGGLFCAVVRLRRRCYRAGWLKVHRVTAPVIVVGNITLGGTGKTPLVLWLSALLRSQGFRPGIVSRGYGARAGPLPREVGAADDPGVFGDEPVLLAARSGCPVAVCPQRVAAARLLIERHACDVLVADDGLQHYALDRDVEVAVTDRPRGLGNGRCLPAGPLREPPTRLAEVDLRVANGPAETGEYAMTLAPGPARLLGDESARRPLAEFRVTEVHAVAGIGHPPRFFATLRAAGLKVIEHPFSDHHPFRARDVAFNDGLPVLMTEKDAVKCRRFAQPTHWYVPVEADLDPRFPAALLSRLFEVRRSGQ